VLEALVVLLRVSAPSVGVMSKCSSLSMYNVCLKRMILLLPGSPNTFHGCTFGIYFHEEERNAIF